MKTFNSPISSGERFSFFQLFTQKDLIIEIPIIQRDYAQGRKTTREVRVKFLEALYNYLDENQPHRDLDFIYGSVTKREDGSQVFIPLDGQQRLTTLFLLHWYLALISDRAKDLQRYAIWKNRSRFSYETRASAREFCDALMMHSHEIFPANGKLISAALQNCGWYFLSWKNDPTVQSMLTMLDAIEERFKERPEFFDRLINVEKPVITFQFLDLREFQLTDDLYIKMNSRGKPLTPFENFKAKLIQRIEELFNGDQKQLALTMESGKGQLKAHEYFSLKMDTDWADFFWKHRDRAANLYDTGIMNFIRAVLANNFAINSDPTDKEISNLFGRQIGSNYETHSDDLSFFDYLESGALTTNSITILIRSFNAILSSENLRNDQPHVLNYDTDQILESVLLHGLTNPMRVKFHAFLGYLMHFNDTRGLPDWMRVVHNLTVNTSIDHTYELIRCLIEIEKLLPNADRILEFLSSGKTSIGAFYQRQVQEEEVKARLILKDGEWSNLIRQADRNLFFNGQISFILEFCGILEYIEKNGHCGWDENENQAFKEKFQDYKHKADASFAYVRDFNEEYLWERTVLTKGDYLVPASYWRKNFLSSKENTRDYSWKRLLRLSGSTDEERQQLMQRRLLIKAVFDDNRFDPLDVETSCRLIVSDIPQDWRAFFISNHNLIKACGHGFIRFEGDTSIRLLTKTKLTYHYELRSYNLYLDKVKGRSFDPFATVEYDSAYGESGVCAIVFRNWHHEGSEYFLKISFSDNFVANFYRMVDNQIKTVEKPVIVTVLKEAGFASIPTGQEPFTFTSQDDAFMIETVAALCDKLNGLDR